MTSPHAPLTLKLLKQFNSIKEIPANTVLPSFTLITGLNGSGKSHLLEAIATGRVEASIQGNPLEFKTEIKRASWADLAPADAGAFSESIIAQERVQIASEISQHIDQLEEQFWQQIRHFGIDAQSLDRRSLISLSIDELKSRLLVPQNARAVHEGLDRIVRQLGMSVTNRYVAPAHKKAIEHAQQRSGLPVFALGIKDFTEGIASNWGSSDIFQHQFGRAFVTYRSLERANRSRQFDQIKHLPVEGVLTDAEFEKNYGMPPWTFVNTAMQDAGLDFLINEPNRHSADPFLPQLTKRSTGAEIGFASLSSGEKVLMALALSLYYAADKRTLAAYPKLLLLDEVDAPLHPSMSAHLIRIIQKTLVERHGIHVIATTHSPSTVALAPEESMYLMEANRPGLLKTTKAQALNVLTADVPTLALSFDGRRQVFVEAKTDADIYSKLWQLLKGRISIDRSLEFIPTGIKARTSESNVHTDVHTGCAVVKHLVTTLAESGVSSAFGLLDWDTTNKSEGKIVVLSEGVRYSLENLLLDPRLLIALLLHSAKLDESQKVQLGLEGMTYSKYLALEADKLQPLVKSISSECFGSRADEEVSVQYIDGKTLQVSKAYLCHYGHELAEKILPEKFKFLKAHSQQNAGLMLYVLKTIVADAVGLLPRDALSAFEAIVNAPSHDAEL
jgi:predicted ATPase